MKTVDIGKGVVVSTPVLTADEAAVYLGVSPRTMRGLPVPRHRVGGQVRYDSREIDEWMKAQADGSKWR